MLGPESGSVVAMFFTIMISYPRVVETAGFSILVNLYSISDITSYISL